jgi:glycerol-1-phosphate dehydrogenase [NAD(P)+]
MPLPVPVPTPPPDPGPSDVPTDTPPIGSPGCSIVPDASGRASSSTRGRPVSRANAARTWAGRIAGSSRPCSGSEHLFSHALDRVSEKPSLHGEQCGVGAIMMMYLHGGDWRKVRSALHAIGAPTTAKELGVTNEEIIEALVGAHAVRPERYTIL